MYRSARYVIIIVTHFGGAPFRRCLRRAKNAMVCTVLPNPISSASTPLTPVSLSRDIQFTPTSWYLLREAEGRGGVG